MRCWPTLEAPEISSLQPAEGAVVGSRPEIRGAVRDQGAGIGREADIEFELDGRPLIAEYDPEAGRVYGHLAGRLVAGCAPPSAEGAGYERQPSRDPRGIYRALAQRHWGTGLTQRRLRGL